MSGQCVIASGNAKKLKELSAILADLSIDAIAQSQFGIRDAEETGTTFVENAIIKARHAARTSGLAAIADDSGICIPALGHAPGIYSARYAGEPSNDSANNSRLLAAMTNEQDRRAYYVCVIVYLRHADDPLPLIAQGIWHGQLLEEGQGEGGFGYDPLFWLPDLQCSAAELDAAVKNRVSHRAIALKRLCELLETRYICNPTPSKNKTI